ncbi:MAG TPA: class II aldolase/adducin family protein [Acidimicrobiales bacterium]|jgi:ribulose-5-phosphate 4-epimerase/fuculose-1-phosphate aldolase|nr:class II aldolase/adducin family protein [Acidimicrobiales bacterium]
MTDLAEPGGGPVTAVANLQGDRLAERAHRKQQLTAAYRLFGRFGLTEGTAGHLTVRDPVEPDTFWAAPYGRHFSMVRTSELVRTDAEGVVYDGIGSAHPAALVLHGAIHELRPDVMSAGHAHSDYGRAMAAGDRRIEPITQDACAFHGDLGYDDRFGGIVLSHEESRRVVGGLGSAKAMILRNHGLLTVGGTVEEMVWWFLSLEKVCKVQLIAEAAGPLRPLDDATAAATGALNGTAQAALINAKPLFEWIVHAEPDAFDR